MSDPKRILICGLNGAGKSTLGRALAEAAGYAFRDIEDYYFPKDDAANPYATARSEAEVSALLLRDLQQYPRMILAAVRANYDDAIPAMLTRAIHIVVPREIRLQRIRERSLRKFGDRALPGGDLYEAEKRFRESAGDYETGTKSPNLQEHTAWLQSLPCPMLRLNGALPPEHNCALIVDAWKNR